MDFSDLSVVVPVGPEERLGEFRKQLASLPAGTEVILAAGQDQVDAIEAELEPGRLGAKLKLVRAPVGRAERLNAGAERSSRAWLWFLHADSKFASGTLEALADCLETEEQVLYYFDLVFHEPPLPLKLNQLGAWLRSRLLGLPFGDQGFLIRSRLFQELGAYPEEPEYGEDHLFVWQAHRRGVDVRPAGAKLLTSPRKYRRRGWLRLTLLYQYLWGRQAIVQYYRYLRQGSR